ncbi:MAG: Arylsulfatase [Verrucomicrobiota bacterium]|jgi:arylsulfatase A-like enzyme
MCFISFFSFCRAVRGATWVLALLGSLCAASGVQGAERPNLIVFIADDVGWEEWGCYGHPVVRTPHVDALAKQGRRYTQAFLTASSCSPSRSSIITGRYPHNLGPAAELHLPVAPNLPWLPSLLRQQGYYTVLVGKNHMSVDFASGKAPYEPRWDWVEKGHVPGNSGLESKWVETLRNRPKDKPFFFWLASADAHRGWDGDLEWDEARYGPKHRPEAVVVPPYLRDDEATRKDLASYYNEITRFDYHVGAMVRALEQEKVLENTLILVLADNGRPFPRAKTRLHDSGMKTGLIAHWPARITQPGSPCDSLLSSIDIAPTLMEAAGGPPIPTAQGVSFLPTFADPCAPVRQHAFSEHNWHDYEAHARAVRSEGYLYIRNQRTEKPWQGPADSVASPSHQALLAARAAKTLTPAQEDVFLAPRPREELYRTAEDPLQLRNLVGEPAHAAVRQRLSKLLDEWMDQTADAIPEDLSPDGYDRETGKPFVKGPPLRGTWPGKPREAHRVNAPGPR